MSTNYNIPGVRSVGSFSETEYKIGGGHRFMNATIGSGCLDAGNTDNAKQLRKGLCLGKLTSGGKYQHYDDAASDGTQTAVAFLDETVSVKNADALARICVGGGGIDEDKVIGLDANGKTDLANYFDFRFSQ